MSSIRILGIDPGSRRTGIGVIDVAADGRMVHIHHAPLSLMKAEDFPRRLRLLLIPLRLRLTPLRMRT